MKYNIHENKEPHPTIYQYEFFYEKDI